MRLNLYTLLSVFRLYTIAFRNQLDISLSLSLGSLSTHLQEYFEQNMFGFFNMLQLASSLYTIAFHSQSNTFL